MILFDVTHDWQGTGPTSDKPRVATETEVHAYVRWLAQHRGIDIAGCDIGQDGAWRGKGKDRVQVLAMPGYGTQPKAIMETLDEAGNVVSRINIATDAKGYMVLKAKQVRDACGLKAVRKARSARKPVERVLAEAAVVPVEAPMASPAPVSAAQPVQFAPIADAALLDRVAALEATFARMGLAIGTGTPAAANDDAAAPRRSEAERRAIQRAWDMRRTMRERADLDRRALLEASTHNRRLVHALETSEAKASDFERIAISEAERADTMEARAITAEGRIAHSVSLVDMANAQAANARTAATDYKREADRLERLLWSVREGAEASARRAERMVRAAGDYRKRAKRADEDKRAAQAEARALTRRLADARMSAPIASRPAAPPLPPINSAMADALRVALN